MTAYLIQPTIEQFTAHGFIGDVRVEAVGSAAGFERFCLTGAADIVLVTRPIRPDEIDDCQAIGRDPRAFRLSSDDVAIVVSHENTFVHDISMAELQRIFDYRYPNWQDIRPEWPNEPIAVVMPYPDSATFDFFVEQVFAGDTIPIEPYIPFFGDVDVRRDIAHNPYAIGFTHSIYFQQFDTWRSVQLNGVSVNQETIHNNRYPLRRL